MAVARARLRPAVLEARDVAVTPPGAPDPVVRGVSFRLGRGEWMAVTGPNGCGKSSLALAAAGLWPVTEGRLALDGADYGPGRPSEGRSAIAMVFQDPAMQLLQPTLAGELAFTALNLGQEPEAVRAEAARVAERLGLADDLERDPRSLSAGGQQAALLAAALATRPRLLVVDEGAAHFDPGRRRAALALVRERVEAGLAVMWVTQSDEEARAADRVLALGDPTTSDPRRDGRRTPPPPEGAPWVTLEVEVGGKPDGPRVALEAPLAIALAPGRATALSGPNGVGKSVVLAAATGVLEVGQVRVRRDRPGDLPPILVSQYPETQVFEERVADEIAFAATARGRGREETRQAARVALSRLGFQPGTLLERRTWGLSSGERRVLMVVAALLAPAGLVALDEPTAGLDPVRAEALATLVAERARDVPVLVASQDGNWTSRLGARVHRLGGIRA